MIRSLYPTPDKVSSAFKEPKSLLGVDLDGGLPEVCEPILQQAFGFHPMAVDDALREPHVPEVDDWDTYICLVLHAVTLEGTGQLELDTLEPDVFGGANYLVIHRTQPMATADRLWVACHRDERQPENGRTHPLYALADELVADYMPVVEGFNEVIDRIKDLILSTPTPSLLEQIFALNRAPLHLRRIIAPQREALNLMPVSFLAGFFGMSFFQATVPLETWTGQVALGLVISAMARLVMVRGNPANWTAAIAVIAIWLMAAVAVIYAIAGLFQKWAQSPAGF